MISIIILTFNSYIYINVRYYIKILLNYFYIHDFAFVRFYSLQANPENFPRERKGTKLKIDRGIENTDFY
jgi:hypothetical protein